ncbi:MAG: YgiT-type zinc finger protein [Deltaproteobacteria bacterium]|nr:YgiT-type zinc finger protein [Deltaproteobacteria bacterium]
MSVCPRCRGSLADDRDVERLVRQGNDVAIVTVRADVCTQCGELLLHPGMADRLVLAARELREDKTAPVLGRVFDFRSEA